MFTVAGISRKDGALKLRFANDLVSRVKVLARNGHQDIELVELPQAMSKDAAVAYLSTLEEFASTEAQAVFADYATKNAPKQPAGRKVAVAPKEEAPAPQEAPKAATKAPRKRTKVAEKDEDLA